MHEFAKRIDKLPPFLFAELRRKIEAKNQAGIDVISLGSADPDTPTAEPVVAAMQAALARPEFHRYPSNDGLAAFREAVAGFMGHRFGVTLDPAREIVPAMGGKEAVHHLALLCLDPGAVCLAPDPGYPVYASGTILAGAELHPLPLRPQNRFMPDYAAIPRHVVARARLLYLNYPNNPTGAIAGAEDFAAAAEFARRHGLIVVHDNAYSEIAFEGRRPPSFLATPGAKEVGVEVFSLSKGWNMTGWRAAWLAGNAEIVRKYAFMKANIDAGMFGALQQAVIAAVTTARDFPRRMSAIYQARRDLMVGAMRAAGLAATAPLATPFLWIPVPRGFTSKALAELILERAHVVVSPGDSFGPSGEGFIRISLCVPDDRLREAAERIRTSLRLAA